MATLCDRSSCSGCLSCYNTCPKNAIEIKTDNEGFWQPVINNEKCINCGLCEKSCPVINNNLLNFKNPIDTRIAWSQNERLVSSSSSGGIFSLLAKFIIENGGSVYGAAYKNDFNVEHCSVDSIEELSRLRGSKYVQSYIGRTYHDIKKQLNTGKKILFSGTPCQVAGLLCFLKGKNYENLITIDIVCHGVPSPKIFHSYLEHLEKKKGGKIIEFNFRQKKWSWFSYNTFARFSNGKTYIGKWEEDAFMRGFLRELFLRPSCHNCNYSQSKRISDITLCDFWGYKRNTNEIDNNDRGVSSIIVNTEKGAELFSSIQDETIHYERSYESFVRCQQALRNCFVESPKRESFWKDFNHLGFESTVTTYLYPEKIGKRKRIRYILERFSLYKKIRIKFPILQKL